jgi:hypothetical protein
MVPQEKTTTYLLILFGRRGVQYESWGVIFFGVEAVQKKKNHNPKITYTLCITYAGYVHVAPSII